MQKVDLEEACRVKDEQSVVRETEFQKQAAEIALFGKTIGHLETQLQQAEVYKIHNSGTRESFCSQQKQNWFLNKDLL